MSMPFLLSGKQAAEEILSALSETVRKNPGWKPVLLTLRFSEDRSAVSYEQSLVRTFSKAGGEVRTLRIPEEVTPEAVSQILREANENEEIHGILPLSPYPEHLAKLIENGPVPAKNVDGLCDGAVFHPATAEAVMALLSYYGIRDVSRKNAVVVGRSKRVGKPVAALLEAGGARVTVCHSKTENLREVTRTADLLVTAVGKAKLIDASFVKPGAVVIDIGMSEDADGRLSGDCDTEDLLSAGVHVTPVPGGVGALTPVMLLKNTMKAGGFFGPEILGKSMEIQIKYFSNEIEPLRYIDGKSDWIDLRCAKETVLKKGEFTLIPLGVAMKLPAGYEALVVSRSSTFKNFGILQANAIGIIDETYSGDDDQWFFPALPTRDVTVHVNDRICQFRILKHQPHIDFTITDHLDDESRGGFGSTGIL